MLDLLPDSILYTIFNIVKKEYPLGFYSLRCTNKKNYNICNETVKEITFISSEIDNLLKFPRLTSLSFRRLNSGIDIIPNQITKLDLSFSILLKKDVHNLQRLVNLYHLNLMYCKSITDDAIKIICKMNSITELLLGYSGITNDGLINISSMINLQLLDINGHSIIDHIGYNHLSSLTNLQHLYMANNNINDNGFMFIDKLLKLETLNIRYCNIGNIGNFESIKDTGFKLLTNLPLTTLNLQKIITFSSDELRYLPLTLKKLDLGCNIQLHSDFMIYIQRLTNLEELNLNHCYLNDNGLKNIVNLKKLKYLNLENNIITNYSINTLLSLQNLVHLNLALNDFYHIEYLMVLGKLKYLNVHGCHIDITTLERCRLVQPYCRIVI